MIDESARSYRGWRVVAGCFLMALFCWGFGLYGHSVYLAELQRLHGWPTPLIATASTAQYLLTAVLVAFGNDAMARLGPRRFVLLGVGALAVSTTALAFVSSPFQLYAAYLLMSFAWTGLGTGAISMILSDWFVERRGLALSLALNGASCGGIIGAPSLIALVSVGGFAFAMLIATAVMLVVLIPVALIWIGPPPPDHATTSSSRVSAASPLQTRADILRSLSFWTASVPVALALIAQVGFIVHQIPILEPMTGRAGAALGVSVMTVMAVIGRLALGAFVDRLDPRLTLAALLVSQAAALFVLTQTVDPALLIVACGAYGVSVGNLITLPPLIIHREFTGASFGAAVSLSIAIGMFISASGPGIIGFVRDMAGSYTAALALCMALKLIAAALVTVRGKPQLAGAT